MILIIVDYFPQQHIIKCFILFLRSVISMKGEALEDVLFEQRAEMKK